MQSGTTEQAPSESATPPVISKTGRLFYGWIVLAVASFSNTIAYGAGAVSLAVFIRPMTESLGWTRTQLLGGVTVTSAANMAVSPIVGRIIDRYGARPVMLAGALVAGVAYIFLGGVSQLWQFYLLYMLATSLGLAEVGSLVTTTLISKWFVRMRGRALGILTAGNSLGAAIVVPIVALLIVAIGWRGSWMVLGLALLIIVLPPVFIFMRSTPESMGLQPDGDRLDATPSGSRANAEAHPWTVSAALRTRTLWLIVLSHNLASLAFSGMLYHLIPAFTDAGLSLQAAALAYSVYSMGAVASKLIWGFLGERIPVRVGLAINYAARAGALTYLIVGSGPERVWVFAVVAGLFSTGFPPLSAQIWADYFGRGFVGSIRGITAPFTLLTSMFGPLFAAFLYDELGSYDAAFWVFVTTLLAGATLIVWARPPGAPKEPLRETVE